MFVQYLKGDWSGDRLSFNSIDGVFQLRDLELKEEQINETLASLPFEIVNGSSLLLLLITQTGCFICSCTSAGSIDSLVLNISLTVSYLNYCAHIGSQKPSLLRLHRCWWLYPNLSLGNHSSLLDAGRGSNNRRSEHHGSLAHAN